MNTFLIQILEQFQRPSREQQQEWSTWKSLGQSSPSQAKAPQIFPVYPPRRSPSFSWKIKCIFRPPQQPQLTKPEPTAKRSRLPWTKRLILRENDPVDEDEELKLIKELVMGLVVVVVVMAMDKLVTCLELVGKDVVVRECYECSPSCM